MPAAVGRLKRRAEFLRVAGAKRRFTTPGLVLQMRPWGSDALEGDEQVQHNLRLGFTVSKKVGNAVERNRARRRLRALATGDLRRLAKPGTDYVLIARRATLTRPWPDLQRDLRDALKRLKKLRRPDREAGAAAAGGEAA